MIDTELMLNYIVKGKHSVASLTEKLGLSELNFIKRVGNIDDFTVNEILDLCHILKVRSEDSVELFFSGEPLPLLPERQTFQNHGS